MVDNMQAKTQKALGLAHCSSVFPTVTPYFVYSVKEDPPKIQELEFHIPGEIFARPCPLRPRHGFVESRVVKTDEQIAQLFEEVRAADPNAEVIFMPFVDAKYNAIYTQGQITIGRGNDGATSGRRTLSIPAPPLTVHNWKDEWGVPYVELVGWGNDFVATQYRGGPAIAKSADFIPKITRVQRVIDIKSLGLDGASTQDLIEWERITQHLQDGDVVYHAGGALSSHYGVHCVINNIPYITTHKPQPGDVLYPTETHTPKKFNWRRWFLLGLEEKNAKPKDLATAALYALHHLSTSSEHAHRVLAAYFAGVYVKLGAMLCIGEGRYAEEYARHSETCRFNYKKLMAELVDDEGQSAAWNRTAAYNFAALLEGSELIHWLKGVTTCFSGCYWLKQFGGVAWAHCAKSLLSMLRARTFKGLIAAWNRSVNLAHNTGWWFNKIVSPEVFNLVQMSPKTAMHCAIIIYNTYLRESLGVEEKNTVELPKDAIFARVRLRSYFSVRVQYEIDGKRKEHDIEHVGAALVNAIKSRNATLPSLYHTDNMYVPCYVSRDLFQIFFEVDGGGYEAFELGI